ncbi:2-oxoglutarate-Fe(II) type oxidoreductase hxnY-like isoform X2 [Mercurialis annua]|uniref:2-oxoglutarate-Fe(II) type oxidoreductase hxnY-like isoform X2 n=1 Tax=Mercurialis annua TaxID=3986 RepID=UPI00215F03CA|nr:2-oxoglutarate-Fe(II) type oxidoreductase hxnY-like isoform X2 [Mercurialis annua]
MAEVAKLPIIDLSSLDRISTANSIRQACIECGFFYVVNHGVEEELQEQVFEESKQFFSLKLDDKMKLLRKEHRGYSPLYAENLDPSTCRKGDSKESFYVGPLHRNDLNQWPPQELLPSWRPTMESYHHKLLSVGKRIISLIALSLKLEEDYFEKIGVFDEPEGYIRLLRYPGEKSDSDEELYGAYSHSDYGMITILATDGVPGLQVCREKLKKPLIWEDVLHLKGSTQHRVMPTLPRYSIAFFLDPNPDCIVKCLESCCSEVNPPKYPPICSGDYFRERFRISYGSE